MLGWMYGWQNGWIATGADLGFSRGGVGRIFKKFLTLKIFF